MVMLQLRAGWIFLTNGCEGLRIWLCYNYVQVGSTSRMDARD